MKEVSLLRWCWHTDRIITILLPLFFIVATAGLAWDRYGDGALCMFFAGLAVCMSFLLGKLFHLKRQAMGMQNDIFLFLIHNGAAAPKFTDTAIKEVERQANRNVLKRGRWRTIQYGATYIIIE